VLIAKVNISEPSGENYSVEQPLAALEYPHNIQEIVTDPQEFMPTVMRERRRQIMYAISVKRQRKLKMKKHKHKKLMKRTRTLRRKLGRL